MDESDRLAELREAISGLATGHPDPRTVAPGVTVFASPHATAPIGVLSEPNVALVAQGAKRTLLGDRVFDYASGQLLVVAVDLPLTSWISEASDDAPFLAVGITLDPPLIAELLLDLPARTSVSTGSAVGESDAEPELVDAFLRLLRTVRSPLDSRVLGPAVVREIHWRLLTGVRSEMIRSLGRAEGELATVARAGAWLRANFDRPYRAEELADAVGLSVSSVNRRFRRATSISPLQYQKQVRLHQARMRLLSGTSDIAQLGYEVGYSSASQFAREYRRLFGRAPRDEARTD
ncbi:AraC family transcriptional regulator [Microbacterium tumbae]